jgi:hypothetical protein
VRTPSPTSGCSGGLLDSSVDVPSDFIISTYMHQKFLNLHVPVDITLIVVFNTRM